MTPSQRSSILTWIAPLLPCFWLGCSDADVANETDNSGGSSALQSNSFGGNGSTQNGGASTAQSNSGGNSSTRTGDGVGASSVGVGGSGVGGSSLGTSSVGIGGTVGRTDGIGGAKGGTDNSSGGKGTDSSGGAGVAGSGTKKTGIGGVGNGGTQSAPSGGSQNSTAPNPGGSAGTSSSTSVPVNCDAAAADECPMTSGLVFGCKKRFALGINYAWQTFGGDFGGVPAWNQNGVSGNSATISAALADMKANGVSVIRWWMFPDFRGGGVEFDANGDATGLSATGKQDIAAALKLAEDNGLYIVLTIFSFDGFRPTRTDNGLKILGLTPMVTDAGRRAKLIEGVVRAAAKAVATSANSHRLLGWDVINEPEWAVKATGNAVGGQDFEPNSELDAITLADMKALINESLTVLGKETPWALRSVGWAAAKWSWAFSDVTNLEFNQPHIYEWVNKYWPYTKKPAELGYSNGKPTVMGEFFLQTNPFNTADTYAQILQSWWTNGYAGAWGWQYVENKSSLSLTKAFAAEKQCQAAF